MSRFGMEKKGLNSLCSILPSISNFVLILTQHHHDGEGMDVLQESMQDHELKNHLEFGELACIGEIFSSDLA